MPLLPCSRPLIGRWGLYVVSEAAQNWEWEGGRVSFKARLASNRSTPGSWKTAAWPPLQSTIGSTSWHALDEQKRREEGTATTLSPSHRHEDTTEHNTTQRNIPPPVCTPHTPFPAHSYYRLGNNLPPTRQKLVIRARSRHAVTYTNTAGHFSKSSQVKVLADPLVTLRALSS